MKRMIVLFTAVLLLAGCASCPSQDTGKIKQDAQKAFNDIDAQQQAR